MTSTALRDHAVQAREASLVLARLPGARRTEGILAIADALLASSDEILFANAIDVAAARTRGTPAAQVDRLLLDRTRIAAMASAVREIAAQDDPIGVAVEHRIRPNGLRVSRVRMPLGVVCVIYEARPNVTSDAAALALRSGNAILLKGGTEARHSNLALGEVIGRALGAAGLPTAAVQVLAPSSREELTELLRLDDLIDLVIPRGGEGLIRFVAEHSRIPVIKHFKGVCHVFVDATADLDMALSIVANAKVSRPSVCNAAETLLVHRDIAPAFMPRMAEQLTTQGVTLHACAETLALLGGRPGVVAATDEDWATEYLSLDLAVRIVDDLDAALRHIERYGSDHTEAIITRDLVAADRFKAEARSSCVMVNASTRFNDGGELGLGAEIGISTSRLHAYGPMGAHELTTLRFIVEGQGHIR
jgi:glutamate-5-semialdehyde dehydrogenase